LIHDGQHLEAESTAKAYLGHTTVERAVRLAVRLGVGRLLVFHHDPARKDDQLDEMSRSLPSWAEAARQGMALTVG